MNIYLSNWYEAFVNNFNRKGKENYHMTSKNSNYPNDQLKTEDISSANYPYLSVTPPPKKKCWLYIPLKWWPGQCCFCLWSRYSDEISCRWILVVPRVLCVQQYPSVQSYGHLSKTNLLFIYNFILWTSENTLKAEKPPTPRISTPPTLIVHPE